MTIDHNSGKREEGEGGDQKGGTKDEAEGLIS